jgi:hypothetical protein
VVGTADDVPDDLVTGFEETAPDFASANAGILPPKMQRALFIYFCGCFVLSTVRQFPTIYMISVT